MGVFTMRSILDYDRASMRITNLEHLPRGIGARLLLVIDSPYAGEYVAVRWLRKMPTTTRRLHHVLRV